MKIRVLLILSFFFMSFHSYSQVKESMRVITSVGDTITVSRNVFEFFKSREFPRYNYNNNWYWNNWYWSNYSFEQGAFRSPTDFYRLQDWSRRAFNGEVGTLTGGLNEWIIQKERQDSYQPKRSFSNSSSRSFASQNNNTTSSTSARKQN
ncbi:MAG: hypothetical protein ACO3NA_05025 [Flavobacteriaceae bacterium]